MFNQCWRPPGLKWKPPPPEEAKAKAMAKGVVVAKWATPRQGQRGHGGRVRGGPQWQPQRPGMGALSSSRSPGGSGRARPGGLPDLSGARWARARSRRVLGGVWRAVLLVEPRQARAGSGRLGRERRWRKGGREGTVGYPVVGPGWRRVAAGLKKSG